MKKAIAKIIFIIILFVYSIRVFELNNEFKYPEEICYKVGDTVDLGNHFFDSNEEKMDNYSISVIDSEIMTICEFKNRYSIETGLFDQSNDYIILIKTKFKNNSNNLSVNAGIDLMQFIFQESSYTNLVESEYIKYLNDFNVTKFALKPKTEKEIVIPFKIIGKNVDINQIINGKPKLIVSLYPQKLDIEL